MRKASERDSGVPVSAVVATRDRPAVLRRALDSVTAQDVTPAELIVVDASTDEASRHIVAAAAPALESRGGHIHWERAAVAGAAAQRNQGVALATQDFIWFFDDDIILEPFCLRRLWEALTADASLGGVNAMITNQRYQTPGPISRMMFRLMAGKPLPSYAGRVLGPAVNLLPEDRADLPNIVPVEWLNTTCTLYRREALPSPPFPSRFSGYSPMEDVCLSVTVARKWRLANVRAARIFHDSQGGPHKADLAENERMKLVNRHYVMTSVLGRNGIGDYSKLALWQLFGFVGGAAQGRAALGAALRGTFRGIRDIACARAMTDDAVPSVVVGIATRNRAALLAKAIVSVQNQSHRPLRIAVVDDASEDGTPELRDRFPGIAWRRLERPSGHVAARNLMMLSANEKYFVSLDDDAWFLEDNEIALAVAHMEQHPRTAAVAFDILSPERSSERRRGTATPVGIFIGCGHVVRLSAVKAVGGYRPFPGFYGAEEKDLSLQLLDRGYDIMRLDGVHVWHDKTPMVRDLVQQHRSGVCNDLSLTVRRTPAALLGTALTWKFIRHLVFARRNRLVGPCLLGFGDFLGQLRSVWASREPVSVATLARFRALSRPQKPPIG